ncbi:TetR/AcrR family transcriptional regulator [Raoultibacter phocaeensis]|uniref:TetR/AcrR family transcriptional regulator n=1 Tax=Raoultibacter phocaeensis TaxID=2479841 RepID=UPI0011185F02|nr:TetR/AcrR family transcriptional regulator [Raoultibacter phocaeensis]
MDDRYEKFESLSEERQEAIVNAAVEAFGKSEYKGASTEEIARKAGISKGLLFFYFKNKKELYVYLIERLTDMMTKLVVDEAFYEIDDFFELLAYAANSKRAVLEKIPHVLDFSIRAYYPEHKDIKDTMDDWTQRQIDYMFKTYFKNVRFDKFKDEVDPKYVLNMLIWMADGYMHQRRSQRRPVDIDDLMDELNRWCEMFRLYAYKEEYL